MAKTYEPSKCYCLDTSGYHGTAGHIYLNGKKPFVENDQCVFGCGCRTSYNGSVSYFGIDPYKECPARKLIRTPAQLAERFKSKTTKNDIRHEVSEIIVLLMKESIIAGQFAKAVANNLNLEKMDAITRSYNKLWKDTCALLSDTQKEMAQKGTEFAFESGCAFFSKMPPGEVESMIDEALKEYGVEGKPK